MMFVLLIIGIIWITGLAPWLTQIGVVAVANGSTGLDGFFFSNLNGIIAFFYILSWFVILKFG